MPYLLEHWQQHAARDGDIIILRHMPIWDVVGYYVATFRNGQAYDTGIGIFETRDDAERAARQSLGAI